MNDAVKQDETPIPSDQSPARVDEKTAAIRERANRYAAAIIEASKNPPPNLPEDVARLIYHHPPKPISREADEDVGAKNADDLDNEPFDLADAEADAALGDTPALPAACGTGNGSGQSGDPPDGDSYNDDGKPDYDEGPDEDDDQPDDVEQPDEDSEPDEDESPDERVEREEYPQLANLLARAADLLKKAEAMVARALGMLRRTAIDTFRGGALLHEAQGILKSEKRYRAWLKKFGIKVTSAWEAVELFRRAKTEDAIQGMTITEAKRKFGIWKKRKQAHGNRALPIDGKEEGSKSMLMAGYAQKLATNAPADDQPETDSEGNSPEEKLGLPPRKKRPGKDVPEEAVMTLPPLEENFILSQADEDAFAAFVEATGGLNRSAQAYQAAWNRRQNLNKDLHG